MEISLTIKTVNRISNSIYEVIIEGCGIVVGMFTYQAPDWDEITVNITNFNNQEIESVISSALDGQAENINVIKNGCEAESVFGDFM